MAKAVARSQEGASQATVVERRCPPSQGYGSQGARRKDCESSQANRGRNASKGEGRRHLAQHDAQEASAREKALRWRANRQTG